MKSLLIACLLSALGGCATLFGPATNSDAFDTSSKVPTVDDVFARVKQEVGYYESTQPKTDDDWKRLFIELGVYDKNGVPLHQGCGTGKIRLNISKVTMDFSAIIDSTAGANASLKIPFGPPISAASASPSVKFTNESVGSIDEKYTYYVVGDFFADSPEWQFLKEHPDAAVIKSALDALRNSLIKTSMLQPCFGDTPAGEPDTLTFSVQLKRDEGQPSVGFTFLLFSAGVNASRATTGENSITVLFVPSATSTRVTPPKQESKCSSTAKAGSSLAECVALKASK